MSASQQLWPNVGLTVYQEDGVTVISPSGGVSVQLPLPAYYARLKRLGRLLDYDPLGLSGDPVSVPAITRVSASLTPALASQLPSRSGLSDGEEIATAGSASPLDGRAAMWKFAAGVSAGADSDAKINAANGQWQRVGWIGNFARTALQLMAQKPTGSHETIYLLGYYSNGNGSTGVTGFGEGGGGWFRWDPDCTLPGDGGIVFRPGDSITGNTYHPAPTTAGAWTRDVRDTATRMVKWYGAWGGNIEPFADWIRHDTDAIQACLNSARPQGARILLQEGNYRIKSTIKIPSGYSDLTIEAVGEVLFWWSGPSTCPTGVGANGQTESSMLQIAGAAIRVQGSLQLRVNAGFHCGALCNLGYSPGDAVGTLTGITLQGLSAEGNSAVMGTTLNGFASARYALAFDFYGRQGANAENFLFEKLGLSKTLTACVRVFDSVQPYNTKFRNCTFFGGLHSVADGPWGIGFINDTVSAEYEFENLEMQRIGICYYFQQYPYAFKVSSGGGEQMKRLLHIRGGGATQSLATYKIQHGRYSLSGARSLAMEGDSDFDLIAANDPYAVRINGTSTLILENVLFNDGFQTFETKILAWDNDIISRGCVYGARKPFVRENTYGTAKRGRTYSQGDVAEYDAGGGSIQQECLPTLEGAENGSGSVTISGTSTFADVTFTGLTHGVNEITGANDYNVSLQVSGVSGTPTLSTPYCTSRATTGFRVNLASAPGAGNSVTVQWRCWR